MEWWVPWEKKVVPKRNRRYWWQTIKRNNTKTYQNYSLNDTFLHRSSSVRLCVSFIIYLSLTVKYGNYCFFFRLNSQNQLTNSHLLNYCHAYNKIFLFFLLCSCWHGRCTFVIGIRFTFCLFSFFAVVRIKYTWRIIWK